MTRLARNFLSGTLTSAIVAGDTDVASAGFAFIPVIVDPDFCWIVLDPGAGAGVPEVIKVTVHTETSTTLTAIRGQQTAYGASAPRSHDAGVEWRWAYTAEDFMTARADITTMQSDRVTRTGDTMTGTLTISGAGQGVILPSGEPSAPDRATRKDYVDTQVATRLATAGGTMTGPISSGVVPTGPDHLTNKAYVDTHLTQAEADALFLTPAEADALFLTPAEGNAAYVNITGDTMTGGLNGPYFAYNAGQPGNPESLTRKDYVDAQDAAYYNGYTVHKVNRFGDTMTGVLYFNADPFAGQPGSSVHGSGTIGLNKHATSSSNIYCFHSGAAFADGSWYAGFCGQTAAHTNGAITQVGGSGVNYYSSSDYRLKDDLGPVEDPVGKLMALQPKHLRWKADGMEFDGFIAHELDEVIPYAVTGEKDAVNDDGSIKAQMADATNVVALLTAALQDAHTQIADLTTRIETLEGATP